MIGFANILEIQTCWLSCTDVGNGSYSFNINEFWLPVQVVINLLSPSPKCKRWLKYFEGESLNKLLSNWFINASAILLIATFLGIV